MNNGYVYNLNDGVWAQDAVTLRQLKAVEAKIPTTIGTTDPNAVHYDTGTSSGKVTLAGGAAGTTITNLKDANLASGSKDAVNGGQLFTTNENVTNVTNNLSTLSNTVGGLLDDALLWSDGATAFSAKHDGANAKITDVRAGADSVAIGLEAEARQDRSIAMGNAAVAANVEAVAIGQNAVSNGVQSVAIGSQVTSFGANSIAIGTGGTQVTDTGARSTAIGYATVVGGTNTLAIGNNILSEGSNNVLLGNNASDEGRGNNLVSVGSKGAERQVIYVKSGTQDTDAVNVSQLKGVTTVLGGGAAVDSKTGAVTAPTYTIKGTPYNDVGAALNALATAPAADALMWDTTAYTAKHAGINSKVTNLAAGTVATGSTEAINGSQLYATNNAVSGIIGGKDAGLNADGTIKAPTFTVDKKEKTTVADAIAALDAKSTTITTDALMWDGTAYNAQRGGTNQRITGVASAINTNDAINKGDLETAIAPFKEFSPKLKYIKFGATTAVDAYANGNDAISIGGNAFATSDKALAIGANANVGAANSVAIGFGSIASDPNTFAVGGKLSPARPIPFRSVRPAPSAPSATSPAATRIPMPSTWASCASR